MRRFRLRTEFVVLPALLAIGAGVFGLGIRWGLPSRRVEGYLFGRHPVWTAREIMQLAGPDDNSPGRAADVSAKPVERRDRPVELNMNDQERARIVRRYRLMSYQPDEFVTLKSLSEMKPSRGDLDPKMYKYGGLWIYPVGALLKLAGAAELVHLDPDQAYYLDHPEAFGRFYVVARVYSTLWGLVGIVAVFTIVRRITGGISAAAAGGLCFTLMPVVVNAAHEAKPHLAGAVLMLLSVLAAARFVEGKRRGHGILAAILCGAAVGMVPSALPVLLVLPMMVVLGVAQNGVAQPPPAVCNVAQPPPADFDELNRIVFDRRSKSDPRISAFGGTQPRAAVPHLVFAAGIALLLAILVYCITNPYVPINLVRNREVLRSNFINSATFYRAQWTGAGLPNALLLIGEGASFVLAAGGLVAMLALAVRAVRRRHASESQENRRRTTGLLLAVPSIVVAGQFILFAAGQPADYARFALPFDIFLAIEAVVAVATFIPSRPGRAAGFALLLGTTAVMGSFYVRAFVRDTSDRTTRLAAADRLQSLLDAGNQVLVTQEEPAPWSMPPADLFRWRIVLPPRTQWHAPDVISGVNVRPADWANDDRRSWTRWVSSISLSWASKPFDIKLSDSLASIRQR